MGSKHWTKQRAQVPNCSLIDDHDISSIFIKVFAKKRLHKGQIWRFAGPKNVSSNCSVSSRCCVEWTPLSV
ncbi:unnamed protein product [Urochloa humidicola]